MADNSLNEDHKSAHPDRHESSVKPYVAQLIEHYLAAYKDFWGVPSNVPCIYRSGLAWPERTGPKSQRFIRDARPVYSHPIAHS